MSRADLPTAHPGPLQAAFDEALAAHADVPRRLWERDHTLWRDDPTEIADRLGWLDAPTGSRSSLATWQAIADDAAADGVTDVVVCGMGGSSLFPDVLARTFRPGRMALHVLDSTHPAAVRRALDLPMASTLFVVSSKSGTTLETRSHLDALWASRAGALDDPGRRFVAVTDPGSALEQLASERGFRAVVHGAPDVGGRFSALTAFGLLPALLADVDAAALLDRAEAALAAELAAGPGGIGHRLGVLLAVAARAGRDKVTLVLAPEVAAFGDWVEQLVAESLGKQGTSVVPVVGDDRDGVVPTGADRVHVVVGAHPSADDLVGAGGPVALLACEDVLDLGAQVLVWEVATAVAGAVLGVHPFDQPDVAAAKSATAEALASGPGDVPLATLDEALAQVRPGDLVALTAFVDPGDEALLERLEEARVRLRDRLGNAVTLGLGPRYLHSTGQLHKGGDEAVVVLQVLDEPAGDVAVPGRDEGFAGILRAQADGDLAALRQRGRRALRLSVEALTGA